MLRIFGVILLAAGLAGPAWAQGEQGIAIAAAPSGNFQACHGDTPEAALACARQKCAKEGGGGACLRVRWCFPAGYSGAMSYLSNRSVTEVAFLCGAPSLAALGAMLTARCNAEASASECRLMVAWGPDGSEEERTDALGRNYEEGAPAASRARPAGPETRPIISR